MPPPLPTGILRPSQAPRWGECAGSFALEGLFPDLEDSPEAREGTAAHYFVTEELQGRLWPVGTLTPNGHPIDVDMVKYGQEYVDDVRSFMAAMFAGTMFRVETKVFAHQLIHPKSEGTPDTFAINLAAKRAALWDYKYGHKYVGPFRNWQTVNYWAGIFEGLSLTRADVADMECSTRIVQPRNYHPDGTVRIWNTTGAVIWDLIEELRRSAILAYTPAAPTRTGPQCRDCNGRHACDAFMRLTARDQDMAGETTPVVLPPAALGKELERITSAIKRLEARKDGLSEQGLAIFRGGGAVPGWTMGRVDSRERWKASVAEVVALGNLLGFDLSKADTVTPAAARKLGIDASVIAAYAEKPTGAHRLIPSDENDAGRVFAPPPAT